MKNGWTSRWETSSSWKTTSLSLWVQPARMFSLSRPLFPPFVTTSAHHRFPFPTDFTASCERQQIFIIGQNPCVFSRRTSCCSPAANLSTWCTSRRQSSTGLCANYCYQDTSAHCQRAWPFLFSSVLFHLAFPCQSSLYFTCHRSLFMLFHLTLLLSSSSLLQWDQPEGETVSDYHWRTGRWHWKAGRFWR